MFQMEIPRIIYLIFPTVSFFVCSFSKPVPTAKPAAKPLLIKGKVFQCHFIFIITQRKTFLLNSLLAFFQFVHSRKRLSLSLKFCRYYTINSDGCKINFGESGKGGYFKRQCFVSVWMFLPRIKKSKSGACFCSLSINIQM